jgi:peptidoglycan hydrolase CwlO-like protein
MAMTQEKILKVVRWVRDYGIIILSAILIVLAIEFYIHDTRVEVKVLLSIEQNSERIINNTNSVDTLRDEISKLDSIVKNIGKKDNTLNTKNNDSR